MKVKDIMRKDFVSFQADDTLEHVVKTFAKKKVTSAPVFDGKEFIGILSDLQIVDYFTPKKFLGLWKKKKQTPIEEIKKFIAIQAVRKPGLKLKEEQDLSSVVKKIVNRINCIPVFNKNKKLVGIIRSEDIINFFFKEFATHNCNMEFKNAEKEAKKSGVKTELDAIYKMVNERGKVSIKTIAKELGVSVKTAEKLGECLDEHHLVKMDYSFFRGARLRRINNEK